ncbi:MULTISPECIES: ABC transporter ATP-binding protein [unclassified Mesorhizobium]|jgi:branched-chain amino acid transport system ATP-binding protein|uniref:Leucine/isoleucine/valine transporter subunit ATP-binding component of ABC superfamily n=1 Tax=Mesorhizobium plurifarium TaxID=69974 RepID=A0A090DIX9_MESPL|nr:MULTISPECIES: ABC transporter ATP-binding protein [unclassified Mesorhizobium]RUU52426.1 ABC transporter ATP-binding protein [Mesorhizobium sp. M2C.T.Ca.TU.009.01.2.1]RUU61367.1 ABC transporter ATP-binding protein [Mesorhizobium sp. M2C.T.Ca.TU.002.02.1.1]CDX13331.1 leucine/isoleucine/valine transporter subunit; ATP-binding component of ABC superfamily [Mesorhizobium plurifarium]CDX51156.1 leucine/isoleucine/valine transporter subunit; ATP-binding component of ABC superfamily [Mesorhizobium 
MTSTTSGPLLRIAGLSSGYGRVGVLENIDIEVDPNEIVVVLGPNGAGKTTLLNSISGVARPTAGSITFEGRDITGMRPEQVVRLGITHCPEGRQIFQRLTVEENLVAAHIRRAGRSFEALRAEAFDLFPVLKERRNSVASRMSGGQQQMLAIGRALMAEPKLLMLDEPSLGLAPKIVHQIFRIILDLSRNGISILLVEQNVQLALECGDYAYLLNTGKVKLHGPAQEMAEHSALSEHYLGGVNETVLHV